MREASDITIDTCDRGDTLVVLVVGEVDTWTVHHFGAALAAAQASGARSILVDLDQVSFMDSSGLHMLLQYTVAAAMRGRLTVTQGSSQVRRLFQVSGVGRYMSFASPPQPVLGVIEEQASTTPMPR